MNINMNIQKRIINTNFSKSFNQKLGICIHTMVGTLDSTDSWFRNPDSKASSHYGVDLNTDMVYQWVEENNIAWAQGNIANPTNKLILEKGGNPNDYFISIECADGRNPSGADRSNQTVVLAQLVKDVAKRNNIPLDRDHICGHREIYSRKSCPGNLDIDRIVKEAKAKVEVFLSDDERRALAILNTFKETNQHGNLEGAINALVGAHGDLEASKTSIKTLESFRDGVAKQLNREGEKDTSKIATELSEALKEHESTQNEATGGLKLFEVVRKWTNGKTWIWPDETDDLIEKFNEKATTLPPAQETLDIDNLTASQLFSKWLKKLLGGR